MQTKTIKNGTKNKTKKGNNSIKSTISKLKEYIKNIFNFIMKHKIIFGIFILIILIIIFTLLFIKMSFNITALTINEDKYSKADMNMVLYNLKYSFFNKDAYEIPEATLEEKITSINMTVSEYLKEEAVTELKYQSAIKSIAKDNNISLTEEELKDIDNDIKSVINSFGGKLNFLKFLYKNKTNEEAYISYLKANKLYDKVYEELYTEGKKYYLDEEEIKNYTSSYNEEYYKINQIILATVDKNTYKSLSDTSINQKKTLIETIKKELDQGADFVELVNKYSEEASEDNDLYYTKDDVLEEVYNVIISLNENEISNIIKTDYAYSIIKRLPLDDKKLNEYLNKKAKVKLNNNITKLVEDYKVFYENTYKKIK